MAIIGGVVGLILMVFLLKLLSVSITVISKLLANGISGLILLLVFNFIGGLFNTTLAINFVNALVAGFFGIPGVIVLLLFEYYS